MNTNRLVLCVAAAGLLLSGCSSQSDSDASESTSAATSTSVAATSRGIRTISPVACRTLGVHSSTVSRPTGEPAGRQRVSGSATDLAP